MNAPPALNATDFPSPVFTLGSALRWLGHDCPDHCSETVDDLTASVWFLRRGRHFVGQSPETLVLLDPTDAGKALARIRRMSHVPGTRCG